MTISGNLPLAQPAQPSLLGLLGATPKTPTTFSDYLKNSIEAVDRTQKGAEAEVAKAVTGDAEDLHKTVIALQSAELNFQLALQIRNKFVNAFEEVMRMPV